VTVVPTCIDAGHYAGDHPKPRDSVDLVWIGSHSTRKYLVGGDARPAPGLAARGAAACG
jgi:hypothetical protein